VQFLDYLDSERTLLETRREYASVIADLGMEMAGLERATARSYESRGEDEKSICFHAAYIYRDDGEPPHPWGRMQPQARGNEKGRCCRSEVSLPDASADHVGQAGRLSHLRDEAGAHRGRGEDRLDAGQAREVHGAGTGIGVDHAGSAPAYGTRAR